jgi:hypothetical protein
VFFRSIYLTIFPGLPPTQKDSWFNPGNLDLSQEDHGYYQHSSATLNDY